VARGEGWGWGGRGRGARANARPSMEIGPRGLRLPSLFEVRRDGQRGEGPMGGGDTPLRMNVDKFPVTFGKNIDLRDTTWKGESRYILPSSYKINGLSYKLS
jgi:hypothetical protein